MDNSSGEEIYLTLRNGRVNRAKIGFSNNGITFHDDSIYLSSANFDLLIPLDDLEIYGIKNINQLDFTLRVNFDGMFGDAVVETPILLILDVPLPE